jgi:asparagine N-glycosylation enzyme membrane subunit Stt3
MPRTSSPAQTVLFFMLTTIAVILLILWLLGVLGVYSIGWFIHVLLVIAVVLFLIRVIQGRNPLK